MLSNQKDLEHLYPLSRNFIYAPEIGLTLRFLRPDWWRDWINERRHDRYLLPNALGFAFLKHLESNLTEKELLQMITLALENSGSRVRLALEYQGDKHLQSDFPYEKEDDFKNHLPLISLVHTPAYRKALERVYENEDNFLLARGTELSRESITENTSCLALCLRKKDEAKKRGFASYYLPFHSGLVEKEKGRDGGLLNTLSIAAAASREKAAIINISRRHHLGTQDIFYNHDRVFTLSVHDPLPSYTGTGGSENTGIGKGEGYNENIEYPDNLSQRIFRFRPEMIYLRIDNTLPEFHQQTKEIIEKLGAPYLVEASDRETLRAWSSD